MAENETPTLPPENFILTGDFDHPNEVNMKCTTCDISTIHSWVKIVPSSVNVEHPTDLEEIMKLVRRLIMCQTCGTLSLKK